MLVTDTRIGIVHHGDTLMYDVKAFKSDTDTELKQVLSRMPGIEVDQNGDIKYNGKKIEKLLIEGKDILQDQHRLAGESLNPNDVSKIQIIEQYRSFRELFSKDNTDKVALNIILTDEAIAKINGEIQGQVGIPKKYTAKSSLYRVADTISHALFVRSNNVGEPTFTAADYINMQHSWAKTLENADGNINNILPSDFIKPWNVKSVTEHFIATSTEIAASNTLNFNLASTGFLSKRQQYNSFDRIYFPSSSHINGMNNGSSRIPFLNLSATIKYKVNPTTHLEIYLPFEYKSSNTTSTYQSEYSNMFFDGVNTIDGKKTITTPSIYLTGIIKSKLAYGVNTSYHYENASTIQKISELMPIFNSDYNMLIQNQVLRMRNFDAKSYIYYNDINMKFGVSYRLNTKRTNNNLMHEPDFESLKASMLWYQDLNIIWDVFVQKETGRFLLKTTYEVNKKVRMKSRDLKEDFLLNDGNILLKYSIAKFHFLMLKIGMKSDIISFENCWENDVAIDSRTLHSGYYNAFQNYTQAIASLSYLNFNIGRKRRLYIVMEYLNSSNPIILITKPFSTFIQYLPILGKSSKKIKMECTLNQPLSKVISARIKLDFNHQHQTTDAILENKFRYYNFQIGFSTSHFKWVNFDVSYSKSISNQLINTITYNGVHDEINLNINTKGKRHIIEFANAIHTQKSNLSSHNLVYLQSGFKLGYNLKSNLSILLEGRDIFNLNEKQIFKPIFRENYVENQQYFRFPGSITFGIKVVI